MDVNLDELYNRIPPTELRNIDEKFRPARTSAFWMWVANQFFFNMLENRFSAFRYKGFEKFENRDKETPIIFYAQHCNWWDGIVAYNLCRRVCKKEIRLMVEELNRFPLLRRAGAFSVNKKSPQASMKSLQYAVRVLQDLNNILYLYPQGIINPPNARPIVFQSGLAYIVQKAIKQYGKVNLMPLSVSYLFLRDNRPEIWLEFGDIIECNDAKFDKKEYSNHLAQNLEKLCDNQLYEISQANFEGYKTLFQKKLAWYRKFEQYLKRIKINRKTEERQ